MTGFTISPEVLSLIDLFFKVVIWTLIITSPFNIVTLEMYFYTRYKKYKNKEEAELEQIIVKRSDDIVKKDKELTWQDEERHRKQLELDFLDRKIAIKKLEAGEDSEDEILMRHQPADKIHEVEKTEESEEKETTLQDPIPEEPKKKELKDLTIRQMRVQAKKHGLKFYSNLNKQKLLNLLEERNVPAEG